jgi:hypothetical protein
MPSASKETASRVDDMGIMEGRYEELGGYTVGFETFRENADAAPLMKGLPEIIEFGPTEEYGRTMEVIGRNLATIQAG